MTIPHSIYTHVWSLMQTVSGLPSCNGLVICMFLFGCSLDLYSQDVVVYADRNIFVDTSTMIVHLWMEWVTFSLWFSCVVLLRMLCKTTVRSFGFVGVFKAPVSCILYIVVRCQSSVVFSPHCSIAMVYRASSGLCLSHQHSDENRCGMKQLCSLEMARTSFFQL